MFKHTEELGPQGCRLLIHTHTYIHIIIIIVIFREMVINRT